MLSTLLTLSLVAAACPVSVELEGAPDVVADLEGRLRERNIEVVSQERDPACPPVSARVQTRPDGLNIRMTDSLGRRGEWLVEDAAAASAVVASWARSGGMAAKTVQMREAAAVAAKGYELPETKPSRVAIDASGEVGVANNGSNWYGPRLSACARWGAVCAGVAARFSKSPAHSNVSERLPTNGTEIDALAELSYRFDLPGAALIPRVGLGIGWSRLSFEGPDPFVSSTRSVEFSSEAFGARASLALRGVVPLDSRVDLFAGGGLLAAPFAAAQDSTRFFDAAPLLVGFGEAGLAVRL